MEIQIVLAISIFMLVTFFVKFSYSYSWPYYQNQPSPYRNRMARSPYYREDYTIVQGFKLTNFETRNYRNVPEEVYYDYPIPYSNAYEGPYSNVLYRGPPPQRMPNRESKNDCVYWTSPEGIQFFMKKFSLVDDGYGSSPEFYELGEIQCSLPSILMSNYSPPYYSPSAVSNYVRLVR